ncbi:hypothetical protein GQ651_13430 [Alphaproteobacteria bacterium GH1-50]|uniref:Thoeris protein ThsB TIR-like domain-containing protein n=1 Tax=Kangsaoukella pontilimi TaxID=2691042 RepID=A0A7C9MY52_9RHOB|nr:TIR domain-containing protein [Kangsaoukella pontilimi]MXQ08854.1 hypothetical protein [Kangsaoukella pontilimi]
MVKRVFFSFHYSNDAWRAGQVRNIGMVDGNRVASDNDWEQIKRGGDQAITRWISNQMHGKSCVVVLIGAETAGRKWINYEILEGWNSGKGLLGVRIDRLQDRYGYQSYPGNNPFSEFNVRGVPLDRIVPVLDPGNVDSRTAYSRISANIAAWIDHAVAIRSKY